MPMAAMLGTLIARIVRRLAPRNNVALANQLGLMSEHGIETLIIDPASSFPVGMRYLLYERGSGVYYAALAQAQNYMPLGPSSDSPYQAGDFVNIRRLGARKGFDDFFFFFFAADLLGSVRIAIWAERNAVAGGRARRGGR